MKLLIHSQTSTVQPLKFGNGWVISFHTIKWVCDYVSKFQWNFNRNSYIFVQENSFKNVVCQNGGHFVQGEMCFKWPLLLMLSEQHSVNKTISTHFIGMLSVNIVMLGFSERGHKTFISYYISRMWIDGPNTGPTSDSYQSHYSDVIMGVMASQITSLTIVYSTVYSGADQRKHQKLRVTGLYATNGQ